MTATALQLVGLGLVTVALWLALGAAVGLFALGWVLFAVGVQLERGS